MLTDSETLQEMRLTFEAEKNAGEPTGWRPGNGPDGLVMTVPLDVLAQTIGTAWLSFRTVLRRPDMDASISLITTLQGRDLRTWRMDWRPVHSHTNTCGPKELRGLTSHTGIHEFACNAKLGLLRMQSGDLPLCIPVDDEPHDFDAFVRHAFRQLRIANPESAMVSDTILRNDIGALRQIADEVAKALAYAKTIGGDVYVQTPIASPTGRNVGIKLLGGPVEFTITDDGFAMREAELMGAEDICRRETRKVAKEYDLTFNEWELFETKAPVDRIVGLASLVANAVALTLIRTSDRFAERFDVRRREDLAVRLGRIFGERKVSKNVDFSGAARSWTFDARVDLPSGRPGLFSIVTPAPISVAFAYSKLDDVSRLDRPPFLAAVLDGEMDAGDKALLRRPARKLYLVTDADDEFRAAA